MRKLSLIVFALIFAVASISCAEGLKLTYKYGEGETARYKVTGTGNGMVMTSWATGPLDYEVSFMYVLKCTGVDDAGNMTLVHDLRDMNVRAVWNGQPLPANVNLPTITTTIAPNGKLLETRIGPESEGEGGSEGAGMGVSGLAAQQAQFDARRLIGEISGPAFPKEAVAPESRWKQTITVKTHWGQPMTVNSVTTFLDYAALHGSDCARLKTDYQVPLDLDMLGGEMFNISGKHEGSQVAYFDYEAGRVIRADGTSTSRMQMQSAQLFGGGSKQAAATMNLESTISIELQGDEVGEAAAD